MYIIDICGGGPSSGYISLEFFRGMLHLGRVQLHPTYTSMSRSDDGLHCLVVAQPEGVSLIPITLLS